MSTPKSFLSTRRNSITMPLRYWNERRSLALVIGLLLSGIAINLFFSSTIKPAAFAIRNAWSKRPGIKCDMAAIAQNHLPTGKHHMVDMYGVSMDRIRFMEDPSMLSEISKYITDAGMTVLDVSAHHFECGGITATFLLSESHLSIHTWPEHGFMALDVYTCGAGKPEDIVDKFKSLLKPKAVRHTYLDRGADRHLASTVNQGDLSILPPPSEQVEHIVTDTVVTSAPGESPVAAAQASPSESEDTAKPHAPLVVAHADAIEVMTKSGLPESHEPTVMDICVNGDTPDDDCLLLRAARIHADVQSPFQRIEIVDTNTLGRCMLLDRVVQFCTEDNDIYTANIADRAVAAVLPAARASDRKLTVTIIGGGDGWVASHLLDHYGSEIASIRIVDIDQQVAQLTRAFFAPEGEHSSFSDPRVHWTFADAGKWLADLPAAGVEPGSSDLVIVDCTDQTQLASAVLYTEEFYGNAHKLLRSGGRIVQQMNTVEEEYEPFFDEVRGQWARIGFTGLQEWTAYMRSFGGMSLFWMSDKVQ
ncbi:S-adenosyl-L-methionine-dependent methyltransferase [Blastocladiella britannica]|nr:S-adenosyl-L-methionine-dependent methyltransferase [Blastocladiella britannica]